MIQVQPGGHCLRCHKNFEDDKEWHEHAIGICDGRTATPCTPACGKWYPHPLKNRSEYWNTMVDILDGQFPKGECKERGRALVMLAYIEMMLRGTKFDENGEPIS